MGWYGVLCKRWFLSGAVAPCPAAWDQRPRRGRERSLSWGGLSPRPRHGRRCHCAKDPAPLHGVVLAFPFRPASGEGRKGNFNVEVGGAWIDGWCDSRIGVVLSFWDGLWGSALLGEAIGWPVGFGGDGGSYRTGACHAPHKWGAPALLNLAGSSDQAPALFGPLL